MIQTPIITRCGVYCPVGHTNDSACIAMVCRINAFAEMSYHGNDFEPIIGSQVQDLGLRDHGFERLKSLLIPAVEEALEPLTPRARSRTPILLCVAESDRLGGVGDQGHALLAALKRHLASSASRHSMIVPFGNASAFVALKEARKLLNNGSAQHVLIAGVDSLIDPETLLWLSDNGRLKSPSNADGLVPGEAGAALLLELQGQSPDHTALEVLGLGFGREAALLSNDEPLRAEGLSAACHGALTEAGRVYADVGLRLSDISGEEYAFREQALCMARVLRAQKETLPIWLPADSLGEVGAAAGVMQLALARFAGLRGYAPAPLMLGHASSMGPERAVALLRATPTSTSRRM